MTTLIQKTNKCTETVQYSKVTLKWQEIKLIPSSAEIQQKIEDVEVIFLLWL